MNPLLASAAFGFAKGLLRDAPSRPASGWANFGAPVVEELQFRAAPALAGVPGTLSAFAFATEHVRQEQSRGIDAGWGRFADVLAGGLLYEMAYKRWGFFGAVASHVAHNVACGLGAAARPATRLKRGRR
jgi:hypothetical protein